MGLNILLIIAGIVVVFLILREAFCWYFKINERVSLQKESNANQLKIIELIMYQQGLDKFDQLIKVDKKTVGANGTPQG